MTGVDRYLDGLSFPGEHSSAWLSVNTAGHSGHVQISNNADRLGETTPKVTARL